MSNIDEKQCLECGWFGDISECTPDKQWSEHAGGGYINIPLCPKCSSEHIVFYDSKEARDARLMFLGEK